MLLKRFIGHLAQSGDRSPEKLVPVPFGIKLCQNRGGERILLLCRQLQGCFECPVEKFGHSVPVCVY